MAEANRLRTRGASPVAVARLLRRAGEGFSSRSEWAKASAALLGALELLRQSSESERDIVEISYLLAVSLRNQGLLDEAAKFLRAAATYYQRVNDSGRSAACIAGLGDIALAREDFESAEKNFEQAIFLCRMASDRTAEAEYLRRWGDLALSRGDHRTAQRRYLEALELNQVANERFGEASTWLGLGELALRLGEFETARARYQNAEKLFLEIQAFDGAAASLLWLGSLAERVGDRIGAKSYYERSVELFQQSANLQPMGYLYVKLARLTDGNEQARYIAAARDALSKSAPWVLERLEKDLADMESLTSRTPPAASPT